MKQRRQLLKVLAAGAAVLLAGPWTAARAQDYPAKPIKLVVPFGAGSTPDVFARIVGEQAGKTLGQAIVVENRAGAGGNLGTNVVAKAAPDGYTIGVSITGPLVNNTLIYDNLPYDPFKDLAPIGGIGITPTLIVAATSVPANDIKGLVDWSKTKPDGLNYSTAGYGLQQHLASEEIAQRTGAKFTHVAYRGGGTAMTDLIAARLDFGGFLAGTTKPLIASGQLRGLAIVAEKRSDLVPDIPTTTEQGLPGMNAHGVHFMMFAPAATPRPVVALLEAELKKIIADPALAKRFADIGFDATPMSGEEVAGALRQTGEKLVPVIKRLNIKLD